MRSLTERIFARLHRLGFWARVVSVFLPICKMRAAFLRCVTPRSGASPAAGEPGAASVAGTADAPAELARRLL
jgi:hypothetical protein